MTINGLKELKHLASEHLISLGAMLTLQVISEHGKFEVFPLQSELEELKEAGLLGDQFEILDKGYEFLSMLTKPEIRMFNEFMQLIPTSDKFATFPRTTALRSKFSKNLLKELYQRVIKSGVPEELILQKFAARVEYVKRTSYLCNNLTTWSPYKTLEDLLSTKANDGVINRSSQDIL